MLSAENLWKAVEDESGSWLLYRTFAEQAEADGQRQLARLFRAVAESELVGARAHLKSLGAVGSSTENVRYAAAAQERKFQDTYARYLRDAQDQCAEQAAAAFGNTLRVQRAHHRLFVDALAGVLAGRVLADEQAHVCGTCGNTVLGQVPDSCEFCGSPAEGFHEVQ